MNTARIKELNDAFRKGLRPELGRIMITAGARHHVAAWPLGELMLYERVKNFDAFTEDNNPHGENDFGSFEYLGERVFFKLDYYNKTLDGGSEDPADPDQTCRVLTIAMMSEY